MRRLLPMALVAFLVLDIAAPAFAARVRVVHRGPHARRTTVVVHRGFPLHRAWPVVVVRPARTQVVMAPRVFLAPVVWSATVVAAPAPGLAVWEDAETLTRDEEWTEFTLNAGRTGHKLFLEIRGEAQVEFAEVVFANGDTQVVDFGSRVHSSGVYALLDFADGRKVDHVRMVACAKSDEARVVLRMS